MKSLKMLFVLFGFTLVMASCSKDDTTGPVITITSPAEGATLERGKTYPVVGTVTDDEELAEIVAGGNKITSFDSPTKHTLTNLTLTFGQTDTLVNYRISFTAKDKAGNVTSKDVNFKVN